MVQDRLRERAEDDAHLAQLGLERGRHRHAVEHRIHRHSGQHLLLFERDAQFFVRAQQLRIDILQALGAVALGLGRGVVDNLLVVDGRVAHIGPGRFLHLEPLPVGAQAPLQHERRFLLFGRDRRDDVFVQPGSDGVSLDIGDETVLVLLLGERLYVVGAGTHAHSQGTESILNSQDYCQKSFV